MSKWTRRPVLIGAPLGAASLACAMLARTPWSAGATVVDGWLIAASGVAGVLAAVFLTIAVFRALDSAS